MVEFSDLAATIGGFFNQPTLKVSRETVSTDVKGWDSLAHVSLMMEIESKYDIEFDLEKMMSFANVGELHDEVNRLVG